MSRTLLIAPHADDETLFASYLAQRHAAHVCVVYDEGREIELNHATTWLGCSYHQMPIPKGTDEDTVEAFLIGLRDPAGQEDWDRAIVPAVERQGHEEHNLVGRLCLTVFSDIEIIRYRTYAPRGARSHGSYGTLVTPDRPEWIARKLAALSCYRTQIEDAATRPWFYDLLDMREWTA
jgi:LmbE family N-acetylglucosaminyl deacetylase